MHVCMYCRNCIVLYLIVCMYICVYIHANLYLYSYASISVSQKC